MLKIMSVYQPNHNWKIIYENDLLILNAGADKIFAIEDVLPNTANEILNLWKRSKVDPSFLSVPAQNIFDQLVSSGIVKVANQKGKKRNSIAIRFSGAPFSRFNSILKSNLDNLEISSEVDAGYILFVRTNACLKDIVDESYSKLEKPHIFLDLGYHHVFSVGPLVYPGITACLGCLIGRLSNYWGDAQPPSKPKISENPEIIASILARELEKISEGDQYLINKTVSYDLDNYEIKANSIYKLPWCPFCTSRIPIETQGYISLPWIKKK